MESQTISVIAVPVAQIVGITMSALLAGNTASITYSTLPPISLSPAPLMAKQWQKLYSIGLATAPPMAMFAGGAFAYLTWQEGTSIRAGLSRNPNTYYFYLAAALLVPAVIPYTRILMADVNARLHGKAHALAEAQPGDGAWEERDVRDGDKVVDLVKKWGYYNAVRVLFSLTGAVSGLVAILIQL